MSPQPPEKKYRLLFPAFGAIIFCILYLVAAWRYPGGSQTDAKSTGFSWKQNYWCNLLNETAINGQPNSSRTVAMIAMLVLAITLIYFWYFFPQQAGFNIISRRIIQVSGAAAMLTGLFMSGESHDMIINLASLFGLVAIGGTFAGLYKLKWKSLLWFGVLNLVLVGLNNYLYYNVELRYYLPVVQKITFFSFLLWISLISVKLYRSSQEQ
ncbi:hypothetical protein [Pseudobacter ginsenosidimutans]|uniref:DUF998 domain-containing protein n=1 Tax=Pseudobacter ginsenosidimutans TaxID=661488 RepID=A0A4Q7MTR7_9BACT|nr:hypothetical protein [Pseudobacter ginsenosidimutans]QEC40992.1 hypothetical protein FSB84_04520 [Pseudobacter ginsenosidimutans]RZS72262.1 hypothetical protein EV199_4178 [Pseudobacter ginsenosidimutans]